MSERRLCDEGLQVTLTWTDGRPLLTVKNGAPVSFASDLAVFEEVLLGVPLQLSSAKGYCLMEPKEEEILLIFGLLGSGRKTCPIDRQDFAEAVDWLRSQRDGA